MSFSILLYVQYLRGLGHLRRAAAISCALSNLNMNVTFVSGGEPVQGFEANAARFVQLPPLSTKDSSYKHLVTPEGRVVTELQKYVRKNILLRTFAESSPHAGRNCHARADHDSCRRTAAARTVALRSWTIHSACVLNARRGGRF